MQEIQPIRLQRSRTKGYKMSYSPNGLENVYVGRPTKWGNRFKIGDTFCGMKIDRDLSIELFKNYHLAENKNFIEQVKKELKGKNLVCWCSVYVCCHADILIKIANE